MAHILKKIPGGIESGIPVDNMDVFFLCFCNQANGQNLLGNFARHT